MKSISHLTQIAAGVLALTACCDTYGTVLFSEDAEGGNLNQWTGQGGFGHHAAIVADPLRPGNKVISFTGLNLGGDIFTANPIPLVDGVAYKISFEYLGLGTPNSTPGDFGGFFGLSENTPGNHLWYHGTSTLFASPTYNDTLIDDGTWRTYTLVITPPISGLINSVRLMFEDWSGSGGIPGDAYFDNIVMERVDRVVVPEARTWVAAASVFLLIAAHRARAARRG